ncbi:MAG TPA: YHS domain-containing protein [Bacteroidota bacterium]|jgi:Cu+-exporting ATPase
MVKDLVCGMGVEEDSPESVSMRYHGTRYYFCSVDCMLLFSKSPDEYKSAAPKNIARDVVCGMEVDADNSPYKAIWEGKTFYFCSSSCLLHFDASPKSFMEDSHVRD